MSTTKANTKSTTKKQIDLSVEPRTLSGRKVKNLRRQGILPANIFGNKITSTSIQLDLKDFQKTYEQAGETNIITLSLKGESKTRPVLVSNVHLDPVTDTPLHVDFHQIDLTQKVTATVPVELIGTAPAEEEKGAVIVQIINELDVEALPGDLPDSLEVDLSSLKEFGDFLSVKDIKIDATKVEIDAEPDQQVVQAQEPKEEEVEPTPSPEGDEGTEASTDGGGDKPDSDEPQTDKQPDSGDKPTSGEPSKSE
ncbi:50S ribosomal protein L25 [Candidatus Chazhemtobacterium aquaticus]|uniref:Large ribosomal subunit protein bL25 n=1 Tax=Candidatus Chazhemtobacterium aquaticus TaxID=2715735 RepID=A0A857NCG0_9BACT|nr:50S ribosomal protein L25 [Candidatus Chazhemtobacterium aquaticus]QHO63211.1 LSU ribosomal protein L25p [Candidatus Chazhemtobacterium aquaticus]